MQKSTSHLGSKLGLASGGFIGALRSLVVKDPDISIDSKEIAMREADLDIAEMQEITERWKSDNESDSNLAKNIRPGTLASLLGFTYLIIFIEGLNIGFTVAEHWAQTLTALLLTVIGAYFGARSIDKAIKRIKGK